MTAPQSLVTPVGQRCCTADHDAPFALHAKTSSWKTSVRAVARLPQRVNFWHLGLRSPIALHAPSSKVEHGDPPSLSLLQQKNCDRLMTACKHVRSNLLYIVGPENVDQKIIISVLPRKSLVAINQCKLCPRCQRKVKRVRKGPHHPAKQILKKKIDCKTIKT